MTAVKTPSRPRMRARWRPRSAPRNARRRRAPCAPPRGMLELRADSPPESGACARRARERMIVGMDGPAESATEAAPTKAERIARWSARSCALAPAIDVVAFVLAWLDIGHGGDVTVLAATT